MASESYCSTGLGVEGKPAGGLAVEEPLLGKAGSRRVLTGRECLGKVVGRVVHMDLTYLYLWKQF